MGSPAIAAETTPTIEKYGTLLGASKERVAQLEAQFPERLQERPSGLKGAEEFEGARFFMGTGRQLAGVPASVPPRSTCRGRCEAPSRARAYETREMTGEALTSGFTEPRGVRATARTELVRQRHRERRRIYEDAVEQSISPREHEALSSKERDNFVEVLVKPVKDEEGKIVGSEPESPKLDRADRQFLNKVQARGEQGVQRPTRRSAPASPGSLRA